jgi:4,5-dihydroxyphthalate decarboxylase
MTIAFPEAGPVRLRTHLAEYPVSHALRAGEVKSDFVTLDFCGPKQAYEGFKPMVREGAYDASELAIVTFLQAKAFGKPLVALPAFVLGRFQHGLIGYNASRGEIAPKDLEGRRVGVRSYTQTTGVWLRGILRHEYGVDLDRVKFVTFEDPHVTEYRDPPGVERAKGDKKLDQMLLDGDLDAAIMGDLPKDPRIRPLIPDPDAAARAWHAKYGAVQINHIFVVNEALSRTRPDVVKEIFRLLLASKRAAPPPAGGVDSLPFGIAAMRKPLELIIQYALEQKIIPRPLTVDELFDDTTRKLSPS